MCLKKSYDFADPREVAAQFGFAPHLRSRVEEVAAKRQAGAKARRRVVERSRSRLNRYRAVLIRWNRKPENDLAPLHFAVGIITWRRPTE